MPVALYRDLPVDCPPDDGRKQFRNVPSSSLGAPMGRSQCAIDPSAKVRLFCVRPVGGDYDDGGAYWGFFGSPPLYCARDADGNFRQFRRAPSRAEAKAILIAEFPGLRFYR